MKVLLIKDVKALGKTGEVKEVKDGYGKNFLIGKGFAKHATTEVIEQWKIDQQIIKDILEAEIKEANEIKEKIDSFKFTVKHRVGANGHLIGSVTNKELQQVMYSQAEIAIDKKQITLKSKIKTIGIFEADCKLGNGIHAIAKIDVIAEV
ncbi:MAG: 50S ribosomal protein L9 [Epsilonproteobacteria bacterium]|nr:MAG: 50S ribosomal protein L9 [Campylobacterota bacterium]